MSPVFLAVRAVSSEFARRLYSPFVWLIGGALLALLIVAIWLAAMEPWWWLLLAPVIVCVLLFIFASSVVGVAINILRPSLSKTQRKDVSGLVDKLQEVSEAFMMPKSVLIYQLAKDTIIPSEQGFVGKMTSHAATFKPEFQRIIASFK